MWVFQSTRPRGARPLLRQKKETALVSFNPRAHGGRDRRAGSSLRAGGSFNPRAHGGRDRTRSLRRLTSSRRFNPRAHGGRDAHYDVGVDYLRGAFQSTRPRGARRDTGPTPEDVWAVSIHAPTGGATPGDGLVAVFAAGVSIHAPTGGATYQHARDRRQAGGFNPRAHGGRDWSSATGRSSRNRFNPRAHGGRDPGHRLGKGAIRGFNPRAHGGRDVQKPQCTHLRRSFNPRAHGGRDRGHPGGRSHREVSIHAPTGGATNGQTIRQTTDEVSIHAPTGGATNGASCRPTSKRCFNPRAHGGRDLRYDPRNCHAQRFQSTRPRGARRHLPRQSAVRLRVSIHAPTGGATFQLNQQQFELMFQSTRPRGARLCLHNRLKTR